MTPAELLQRGPQGPNDLIGKAQTIARVLIGRIEDGQTSALRLVLHGPAGVGKSAVCRLLAGRLCDHATQATHVSACQVTPELIRDWIGEARHIARKWRVWWIEEVDAVSPAVEVLLLQFLDALQSHHAVLLTSNKLDCLSDRLRSRCVSQSVPAVPVSQVADFLKKRWPELGGAASEIAQATSGDVRAALNDAQAELDARKYAQ